MPRPTDWDALGLAGDPTPGDPDRIDQLARSLAELGGVARDIDNALNMVLAKTGDGAWMGQTADALREKIEGPLRSFVRSIAEAFEGSAHTLVFYAAAMREQQSRADTALSQGRGLTSEEDRPLRDEYAATARAAGAALAEAASSAAATVSEAARGIKQPVSDCEMFWDAFKWLAIILIVPALLVGGPVALLAIGVNLTLFIKTAVDFSQGKAGLLDLFLAGLGMIAPTTKAVPIFQLVGAAAKFTWQGLKTAGPAVFGFFRGLFTGGGLRTVTILPGLRGFAALAGTWIRSGSLWVMAPLTHMPSFTGMIRTSGIVAVQGLRAVPGVIRAFPGAVARGAGAAWSWTGRTFSAGMTLGGKGLGAAWDFAVAQLGGAKILRLVLPVDAGEIGRFGLREALRLGVVERGLQARNLFGAPLAGALGRGAAAVPPPPVQHVGSLLDVPRPDLTRLQLGDWSGMRALDLHVGPAGGIGLAAPPAFRAGTGFGDGLMFAPDAVRRLDALLDTPIHELNAVRVGDWAAPAARGDLGLGVSANLGTTLNHGPAFAGTQGLHTQGLPALSTTPAQALNLHTPTNLHAPADGGSLSVSTTHTASPQAGASLTHAGVSGTSANNALDLLFPSTMNRADTPVFGTGAHLSETTTQARVAHNVTLHLDEYARSRPTDLQTTPSPSLAPQSA
ncbi:putative T7SS-secreted protein, partial [Nonomuraea aridisoli]